MKYVFVFLIGILSFVHNSYGQNLLFGPKVGFQMSRAYSQEGHFYDGIKSKFIPVYQAGLMANIRVTDNFSLETELLYNQTGKNIQGENITLINKEYYHNLTVPALLRGSMRIGQVEVFANAGPSLSYWLGGRGSLEGDLTELHEAYIDRLNYSIKFGESYLEDNAFYVSDPNRFLFSLEAGVGAMIPTGGNYLTVELRYIWGHTDLAKSNENYMYFLEYSGRINHSTEMINVSLGYCFEFDFLEMLKGKTSGKKKSN